MRVLTPSARRGPAATGPAASAAGAAGAAGAAVTATAASAQPRRTGIRPTVINSSGDGPGTAISRSVGGERFTVAPGSGRY